MFALNKADGMAEIRITNQAVKLNSSEIVIRKPKGNYRRFGGRPPQYYGEVEELFLPAIACT